MSASSSTAPGASRVRPPGPPTEADRVAARGRSDRPRIRDRPPRPDAVLDDRPPAHGTLRDTGRRGPVRGPARAQDRRAAVTPIGPLPRSRGSPSPRRATGATRVEDVRGQRRHPDRAGHHPRRRRDRGERGRRRRGAAPDATPTPAAATAPAGYEFVREPGPGQDHAGPLAEEAVELLTRAAVPAGPAHDRPRPAPAVPAGPRVVRPPDRARPRARRGGVARRHQLPDDRQARRASATARDLVTVSPTRPRPAALGTFGWDDEGVPAHARPARRATASSSGYLSVARDRAARSGAGAAGRMRADGWNRIPLIRMTNVNLAAAARDAPRRADRRHRRRPLHRDQPARGRSTTGASTSSSPPRSPGRSRAASWVGCCATRPTPASPRTSGARATRSRDHGLGVLGHANCGKGEPVQVAHVGHGASPRPVPRRPGRRRQVVGSRRWTPIEPATGSSWRCRPRARPRGRGRGLVTAETRR